MKFLYNSPFLIFSRSPIMVAASVKGPPPRRRQTLAQRLLPHHVHHESLCHDPRPCGRHPVCPCRPAANHHERRVRTWTWAFDLWARRAKKSRPYAVRVERFLRASGGVRAPSCEPIGRAARRAGLPVRWLLEQSVFSSRLPPRELRSVCLSDVSSAPSEQ